MIQKKILLLATYPIKNPQHGGQKRVDALVKFYKGIFSEVRFAAVFHRGFYQEYGKDDVFLKGEYRKKIENSPFTGDVVAGEAIAKEPSVRAQFKKLLLSFNPDIIQIEQTFPYFGLKELLEELQMKPKIVLSSHNVEAPMKDEILEGMGVDAKARKPIVSAIHAVEAELSSVSDLTIAVTEEDAAAHTKMGAKKVVVSPNGIATSKPSPQALEYWKNFKQENGITRIVSFVASAHPPNWHGFLKMISTAVGFVPYDTKILLAGSIADYFKDNIKGNSPEEATFWQRVVPVGRLSEERLGGLLASTDVLLLPVIEGGGSNLKTAEAIVSGKKVVATSFAFRSFEKYQNLPNIYIADTKDAFCSAINQALDAEYQTRTKEQAVLAERVTWKYALAPIEEAIKKL